jgi:D-alanyl-lipoteichoic acid acyltransferase DltB (MBOAT superfamily)
MLFNSLHYGVFLPFVFIIYWFLFKNQLKLQNLLLLVSSFYFYAIWDIRFLSLLVFSIIIDFGAGKMIAKNGAESNRKAWLTFALIVKLGILIVFKYFNFFIESALSLLTTMEVSVQLNTLNILLPVGISFYTFHGLSYLIDIYYKRIEPEKNLVNYSVFVSFFPLLVAGPIERATSLLPQIARMRVFNYGLAVLGLKQILWGFFKKVVIADNCSDYVYTIFNTPEAYTGSTLVIGVLFFAVQIYCDFSGYTDIAIGSARLFGIELLRNFDFPYFSINITEFWRKWHISLTKWLTDYVYTPMIIRWRDLGANGIYLAVILTFLISGLWHGAGWNFIIWGLLHGIAISYELYTKKTRTTFFKSFPNWMRIGIGSFLTLSYVCFTYIFFRADNSAAAIEYISNMFSLTLFCIPYFPGIGASRFTMILIFLFFIIEYLGKENSFALEKFGQNWKKPWRWIFYSFVLFLIGFYIHLGNTPFIYFQF